MKRVLSTAVLLAIAGTLYAEPPAAPDGTGIVTQKGAQEQTPAEGFGFGIGGNIDFKTGYYFRAYKLLNTPVIQPDITVSVKNLSVGPFTLTPYINTFNTVTVTEAGGSDGGYWLEAGINPGITIGYDRWSLDFRYFTNFLPSGVNQDIFRRGATGQAQELDTTLSYDDSAKDATAHIGAFQYTKGQFSPIALNPYVLFAQETQDRADNTSNSYWEVGFAPELRFGEKLSFTFPTLLGGSIDHYYTDDDGEQNLFGFIGTGVHAKYQFSKHWDVHGGVDYAYALSGGVASYNADYSGDGSRHIFVGFMGLGFSY